MKIITDDPDWARDMYEARALAMMFVEKHGHAQQVYETSCRVAQRDGLTVTCHSRDPFMMLTIDVCGKGGDASERVLGVEWRQGDAWRIAIETYRRGRWQSRLKAMVYPRPWLERWRAMALFTSPATPRSQRSAGLSGEIQPTNAGNIGAVF